MFSFVSRFSGKLLPILAMGCCLAGIAHAQAANVYVTQDGSSTGSCTASPLLSAAQFNTAGSWGTGSSQIGPGTTVHLCGTFTGAAGAGMLSVKGSGISGHPITIQFESGTVFQSPYWSSGTGAIDMNGDSYIVLDGGKNGLIENTLNGSPGAKCPGGTCQYQQSSTAIQSTPCSGCEIKNMTIADLYVHTQCEASSGCDKALVAFSYVSAVVYSGTNFTADNNVIHDTGAGFYGRPASGTVVQSFYDNDIYHVDHGCFCGGQAVGQTSTLWFYGNHIHDQMNWDTGTADAYHHDGLHAYSGGKGVLTTLYMFNNLFDGDEGQCCITSWAFLQTAVTNAYIFNNVFVQTISVPNGAVSFDPGNVTVYPGSYYFYNNTFLSTAGTGNRAPAIFSEGSNSGDGLSVVVKGNAFSGYNSFISLGAAVVSFEGDNNVYANESGGGNSYWHWNTVSAKNFATWQSGCGCDSQGLSNLSGSLGVSGEGAPQSGSMVLGKGANLISLATAALDPLASDTSAGNTRTPVVRPTTGSWDAGAYESSGQLANAPQAPTNLTATVQ